MPGRERVEFLDEHGRPVPTADPVDADLGDFDTPTLPRWLDPRTPGGRTVLASLLVVLTAWVLSVRQTGQVDTGPGPIAPARTYTAVPVAEVPEPVGPGTYRDGSVGPLQGPARLAAQLLGRLGEGDGVVPPGEGSCAPGGQDSEAQTRAGSAVRTYLPNYGLITTTTGLGAHAELCTLVLWAEHGSVSVAVSVAAPSHSALRRPDTRWQVLSSRAGTLEWVRFVDLGGWTVLVAAFGPAQVPALSALLNLAQDSLLTW